MTERSLLYSSKVLMACAGLALGLTTVRAQSTVTLQGRVMDPNGAALVGARITSLDQATHAQRGTTTQPDGLYQIDNLLPGDYEIVAVSSGFKTVWRRVALHVGDRLTVNFELPVGAVDERVEITEPGSAVNTIDHNVNGSISRSQIENLPLNGRNYLELAQLAPSVQVVSVTNPGAFGNNYQRVLFGGAYYSQTSISVDGSTVTDRFVGGTTQGLSQESVQEFQVATFNLDPATGNPGSGAINIITRRGSNQQHGSLFSYYRDHNLSAYPALRRTSQAVYPFFARRQSGFSRGADQEKQPVLVCEL